METENQKPLTLDQLVEYNQRILLPAIGEMVVSKKEFNNFKNKIYTDIDKLFQKLDILLEDKEIREYQDKKLKQALAIMIKSLKEHQILSSRDLEQISRLEIF